MPIVRFSLASSLFFPSPLLSRSLSLSTPFACEGTWPIWRSARCTLRVLNDMRQFLTPRDQKASTAQSERKREREREGEETEKQTAIWRQTTTLRSGQGGKKLAHSCKHYAMKFIWIGVGSKFKYFSDNNNNNNNGSNWFFAFRFDRFTWIPVYKLI